MEQSTQNTAVRTTDADVIIEKFADASVTVFQIKGIINETFDGKGLARSVRTPMVAVDMSGVTKVSSFGVREWSQFVQNVENKVRGIYYVGCSPKVMHQFNMVSGFAGQGRIYSFYAPYRCENCGTETQVLVNIDRDYDVIQSQRPEDKTCTACGSASDAFDEDPVSYFSFVSQQGEFELPNEVATLLVSRLGYSDLDLARRLKVEKVIEDEFTYLRFSGNLNRGLRYENIAEGLQGRLLVDLTNIGKIASDGAADLHRLLKTVQTNVEQVLLVGVPGTMFERYLLLEEYTDTVQVLSLTLPYTCTSTSTSESKLIQVEEHYDVLRIGAAPQIECKGCDGPCVCSASTRLLSRLKELPRPQVDAGVRKFLKKAQTTKRETPRPAGTSDVQRQSRGTPPMLLIGTVAVAAVVAVAISYAQSRSNQEALERVARSVGSTMLERRPAWITSDTPFTGYCTDLGSRMQCVGVSSFLASKQRAREEAEITALEALVHAVGLKIEDPDFGRLVRQRYGTKRPAALAAWAEAGRAEEAQDVYRQILAVRKAAAAGLQETGGAAMPSTVADWYWEEYSASEESGSNEFLAFVRYDVSLDEMRALVNRYSEKFEVLGAKVMTVFPGLAWINPTLKSGAFVVSVAEGPLDKLGVGESDSVVAFAGQPVRSGDAFATQLEGIEVKGDLQISVLDPAGLPIGTQSQN